MYGLRDERAIARELGRSDQGVRRMAAKLFPTPRHSGPWAPAELQRLRAYLGACSLEVLTRILGRTRGDVEGKLAELSRPTRFGPWEPEELARFKYLYGSRSDEDLVCILGRGIDELRAKAEELCLAKDKGFLRRLTGKEHASHMRRWTAQELEHLHVLYPRHSNLEIAHLLGRSVKSVVSKACTEGLRKDGQRLRQMGRENVRQRYRRRGPQEEPVAADGRGRAAAGRAGEDGRGGRASDLPRGPLGSPARSNGAARGDRLAPGSSRAAGS